MWNPPAQVVIPESNLDFNLYIPSITEQVTTTKRGRDVAELPYCMLQIHEVLRIKRVKVAELESYSDNESSLTSTSSRNSRHDYLFDRSDQSSEEEETSSYSSYDFEPKQFWAAHDNQLSSWESFSAATIDHGLNRDELSYILVQVDDSLDVKAPQSLPINHGIGSNLSTELNEEDLIFLNDLFSD